MTTIARNRIEKVLPPHRGVFWHLVPVEYPSHDGEAVIYPLHGEGAVAQIAPRKPAASAFPQPRRHVEISGFGRTHWALTGNTRAGRSYVAKWLARYAGEPVSIR